MTTPTPVVGVEHGRRPPVVTVEERVTILETEFRTELKHLATKADLKALEMRMAAMILTAAGVIIAVIKLWG